VEKAFSPFKNQLEPFFEKVIRIVKIKKNPAFFKLSLITSIPIPVLPN
jgi:hypothetical protein